jgi:hypothetical protein
MNDFDELGRKFEKRKLRKMEKKRIERDLREELNVSPILLGTRIVSSSNEDEEELDDR